MSVSHEHQINTSPAPIEELALAASPEAISTDLSSVSLVEMTPEMDEAYLTMMRNNRDRLLEGDIDIDKLYSVPEDIDSARQEGRVFYGILHEGALTGGVEIGSIDEDNVEISFWKDKDTEGSQTAKVAVSAIARKYTKEGKNVHASVAPTNEASWRLLSTLKFETDPRTGTDMVRRTHVGHRALASTIRR